MEKKPYVVDLSRRIVDTVIVWAESAEDARKFATQTFVDGMDEFPTSSIWETEVVDITDSIQSTEGLRCMDKYDIGLVQLNKPWNSVEG